MLGLAPDVRILDLGHDIPPHDVRAGSAAPRAGRPVPARRLRRRRRSSTPAWAPTGAWSASRSRAACCSAPTTACSPRRSRWSAGPGRVVVAREPRLPARRRPGPTFAGRDVLAPAAGPSRRGAAARRARARGRPGRAGARARGAARDRATSGAIVGEVWWVDRFGNCQLNIDPGELAARRRRPGRPRRGAARRRRSAPPGGCTPTPTPSRRSWCCSSTPTACSPRARPGVGGRPRSASAPGAAVTLVPEGARRDDRARRSRSSSCSAHPRRRRRPVRRSDLIREARPCAEPSSRASLRCSARRARVEPAVVQAGLGRAGRLRGHRRTDLHAAHTHDRTVELPPGTLVHRNRRASAGLSESTTLREISRLERWPAASTNPRRSTVIPTARLSANASSWPTTPCTSPPLDSTRVPSAISALAAARRPWPGARGRARSAPPTRPRRRRSPTAATPLPTAASTGAARRRRPCRPGSRCPITGSIGALEHHAGREPAEHAASPTAPGRAVAGRARR